MQIETRIDLARALSTLTDRQRAVLYAWAVLGYTQREIAKVLGISQQRVHQELQNAKNLVYFSMN